MLWYDNTHRSFSEVANLVGDFGITFNKVMDAIQRSQIDIRSYNGIYHE